MIRFACLENRLHEGASVNMEPTFRVGDLAVYPAHGVGKVTSIEAQTIGGQKVELFVISFERDRMTLRVPVLNP